MNGYGCLSSESICTDGFVVNESAERRSSGWGIEFRVWDSSLGFGVTIFRRQGDGQRTISQGVCAIRWRILVPLD